MSQENTELQEEQTIDNQSSAETENADLENVDKQPEQKIPYDRFKAKVDEANELKRKLEDYQKERDEAERKRLEENEEYKELADKLQKQLDEQRLDAIKAKKEGLLAKSGYSDEQVGMLTKLLDGETDEEIQASLDALKATVPPNSKPYADPSAGNGSKQEPKKTDLKDKGKSAYQRLKEKGKIRGRK